MKSNYDYLIEAIKENPEAKEWADAFKEDYDKLKESESSLEDEINSLESDIQDLKTAAQNDEDDFDGKEIDCGVGKIAYQVEGSIDLQSIMEALEERIKKDGFKSVLRLLEYDLIHA